MIAIAAYIGETKNIAKTDKIAPASAKYYLKKE